MASVNVRVVNAGLHLHIAFTPEETKRIVNSALDQEERKLMVPVERRVRHPSGLSARERQRILLHDDSDEAWVKYGQASWEGGATYIHRSRP